MKSKHFVIQELVPPEVFLSSGENAWELLDQRLIFTLDDLWTELGPFVVNDWHKGGTYKESGLRSAGTSTGAQYSQHKFGRAADCKFKDHKPIEAYQYIIKNAEKLPYLSTLEDIESTPTWIHVDVRNHNESDIKVVKP